MAEQNINQYVYKKYNIGLVSESMDMSLTSDERDYKEEVIFSPYLIAQTHGNKLPFYFDIDNYLTAQPLNLTYKNYNYNNIFVSQNIYNPKNENLGCFSASSSCDIGFTGIDNGLVNQIGNQTIYFTNGLFSDGLKFNRMFYDRRMKFHQVTGHTTDDNRFDAFDKTTLYEVVSKIGSEGRYHELYGGFYQGFYKLYDYDYSVFPERVKKGWSVEMVLRPRFVDEYPLLPNETNLNELYPQNRNMFFYMGARAENKFYHYADGSPKCFPSYTRVTTPLANCLQTCACCNETITNSRCIYLYPPRPKDGNHDPHKNYGCDACKGSTTISISCGCGCNELPCESCGWECFTHSCTNVITPVPTPTPEPTPIPDCVEETPICTPTCTTCKSCSNCVDCTPPENSTVEDTCEKDPLYDSMSNNIALKLCGDPKNPSIGVKVLRMTGECITTGTCVTGQTFVTGYTIQEFCTDPIYPYCAQVNPSFLEQQHWFYVNVTWERYTNIETNDLCWNGGLGTITEIKYLESLANNTVALIKPPYTDGKATPQQVELTNLNYEWINTKKFRNGRLKIYVNGKLIKTIEDFEEIIPRALSTDKEKQVGVPFNISWGGGTQGLHDNLIPSSCDNLLSDYIQDPESFPTSVLNNSSLAGLKTDILLEQEFAGFFKGAISQFRMYVEPLDASEVRHNFYVLKNKFKLFDPFCPDCDTFVCEPNDLTYVIDDEVTTTTTTTLTPFALGREYIYDERDQKYLIKNNLQTLLKQSKPPKSPTERYWDDNGWWGNQGSLPQCVGYAWAHWLEDGPVQQSGTPPIIPPSTIYFNAQKLDQWPGENYAGTSVRGAVKYLQNIKKVKTYYWAFDVQTLIDTVMKIGPVVVGTNWYYNMFFPDKTGTIRASGRLMGGHAYVINGVDIKNKRFRLKNSWGKSWGLSGRAYISFNDMTRLIREQGEICLATEIGS